MKRAFVITEIKHWNDIFRLNQRFMSNFIYRGQGNADWPLATSLARMVHNHHPNYIQNHIPVSYEQKIMDDFQGNIQVMRKDIFRNLMSLLNGSL